MSAVVEWGIQYPGEPEPRPADSEWRARNWADYWNTHQISVDDGRAFVVSRTVITSDWTSTTAPDQMPAACEHDPRYDRSECVNCGNQCAWCSKCGADVCCTTPPATVPAGTTDEKGAHDE